jgi:hypothetical protein
MPEPSLFRHYQIVQNADGSNVELARNDEQVNVLAFDLQQLEFVHCHVLLETPADRAGFEANCRRFQNARHPLLARLTDFGEDEGNPFYITGNVDGETLQSYLARQTELTGWLAAMLASRALQAVAALGNRVDMAPWKPLESLRVLQTGPLTIQILVADYRVLTGAGERARSLKTVFEKQAKFLTNFLQEHSSSDGIPPGTSLPVADFMELLKACLEAATPDNLQAIQGLSGALLKLLPESLSGEIPSTQKPRSLLSQQLASHQEVAHAVENHIGIQSQRLDLANPYSMRGIQTQSGRAVLVEQVPPPRLVPSTVSAADEEVVRLGQKSDFAGIVSVALVHEADGLTCVLEEQVEGIALADLLRERGMLNAHETLLVLAGLDAALNQLEKSGVGVRRLRLEDVFLRTGFPPDDAQSTRLLRTKLTDWPAFSVMLRVHPTLASMAGRGTDPALILPATKPGRVSANIWDSAWLAAVGRFLLALEPLPGGMTETLADKREIEPLARLLEEELIKDCSNMPGNRGDFLGRYARLMQPVTAPPEDLLEPSKSKAERATPPSARAGQSKGRLQGTASPVALTSGFEPEPAEELNIGFAELLFRGTGERSAASSPDWEKTAIDAPPTIHPNEALLPPDDFVPLWLRAAVFMGGAMIAGGLLAHLSGHASWQKKPASKAVPAVEKQASKMAPVSKAALVPKAIQASGSKDIKASPLPPPKAMPPPAAPSVDGLGLKPPTSLKEKIVDLPPPAR